MRKIKFRALMTETSGEHEGLFCYTHGVSGIWSSKNGTYYGDVEHLMQYTGLKDKNGKEIYEGDFLEDEAGLWEVYFSDGMFLLDVVRKISLVSLGIPDQKSRYSLLTFVKGCEIIGNIYENLELLKNETKSN